MNKRLVVSIWMILLAFSGWAMAQEPVTPPASQPMVVAPAATTQPIVVVLSGSTTQPSSIYDSVLETKIAKIMQGKETLTWDEIRKPTFWLDTVKNLIETVLAFVPRFLGTLIFLLVFWLIYRGIRKLAVGNMKRSDVDSSIRDMLATLIKWCVMGFGVVIACNQLGIPIVAMLTGVSIIGLAVGFAAQETLANFIAGIVIFLDKPFAVGHWVEVDGIFGQVRRVTFRSTRILTQDGETVVFPNTHVLANKVVNSSAHTMNRISVPIGIAYKCSIDDARKALLSLTANDPRVVINPAPEVVVKECADSSVNLILWFWITDESLERRIGFEYIEKAKKALDAAGIEIPFPHMQLFIENTPAVEKLAGAKGETGRN